MSTAPDKSAGTTPAYASWKTLRSLFDEIRDSGHTPLRVDRSLMTKLSGSGATEVMGTMKAWGLIDEKGIPTDRFDAVVMSSEEARKAALLEMVNSAYGFVVDSLDIKRATANQVAELFRQRNVNGSTLSRAMTLFLAVAKEAGITVSPNIKAPPPPRTGVRKKIDKRDRKNEPIEEVGDDSEEETLPEDVHKFELPVPGKPSVVVLIPKSLDADDWAMFQAMFEIYVKRWKQFAPAAQEGG